MINKKGTMRIQVLVEDKMRERPEKKVHLAGAALEGSAGI